MKLKLVVDNYEYTKVDDIVQLPKVVKLSDGIDVDVSDFSTLVYKVMKDLEPELCGNTISVHGDISIVAYPWYFIQFSDLLAEGDFQQVGGVYVKLETEDGSLYSPNPKDFERMMEGVIEEIDKHLNFTIYLFALAEYVELSELLN